jgi:hypothetical protein
MIHDPWPMILELSISSPDDHLVCRLNRAGVLHARVPPAPSRVAPVVDAPEVTVEEELSDGAAWAGGAGQ